MGGVSAEVLFLVLGARQHPMGSLAWLLLVLLEVVLWVEWWVKWRPKRMNYKITQYVEMLRSGERRRWVRAPDRYALWVGLDPGARYALGEALWAREGLDLAGARLLDEASGKQIKIYGNPNMLAIYEQLGKAPPESRGVLSILQEEVCAAKEARSSVVATAEQGLAQVAKLVKEFGQDDQAWGYVLDFVGREKLSPGSSALMAYIRIGEVVRALMRATNYPRAGLEYGLIR
jgi:hypothetical protein